MRPWRRSWNGRRRATRFGTRKWATRRPPLGPTAIFRVSAFQNFWLITLHGKSAATTDPRHALSGRDADWEFGGYYSARLAHTERVRRGRGGGHAADGIVIEAFRDFQAA